MQALGNVMLTCRLVPGVPRRRVTSPQLPRGYIFLWAQMCAKLITAIIFSPFGQCNLFSPFGKYTNASHSRHLASTRMHHILAIWPEQCSCDHDVHDMRMAMRDLPSPSPATFQALPKRIRAPRLSNATPRRCHRVVRHRGHDTVLGHRGEPTVGLA